MNWTFNGLIIDEIPVDQPYGFIYLLTYTDGTRYIGKKDFYSTAELPKLKTDKVREGLIGTKNKYVYRREDGSIVTKKSDKKGMKAKIETYDIVISESDWKKYNSSSKLVKDKKLLAKEMIMFGKTKRHLTYLETKALFQYETMEDSTYVNENILGKFYKDNLI